MGLVRPFFVANLFLSGHKSVGEASQMPAVAAQEYQALTAANTANR
jgi:hypothetical protein